MARVRTVQEQVGVPAGVYVAKVKAVEDGLEGQFGPQIKFYFEIREVLASDADDPEELIGEEKWGWTSETFSPRSKLFKWSKAILNTDLNVDDDVDLDDLEGRYCRITVGENENGTLAVTDVAAHRGKAKSNGKARRRKPEPEPEYDDDEDDEEEDLDDF